MSWSVLRGGGLRGYVGRMAATALLAGCSSAESPGDRLPAGGSSATIMSVGADAGSGLADGRAMPPCTVLAPTASCATPGAAGEAGTTIPADAGPPPNQAPLSTCGLAPVGDASLQTVYPAGGKTFYVSAAGSDSNDGATVSRALASLSRASALMKPGDMALVGDGVYSDFAPVSGAADAYVFYRAMPGQHPKIVATMNDAVYAVGVSYVVIDGFEVEGNRANIDYDYALAHPQSPETSSNGITFYNSHHVVIRNNLVHDVCGGGISANGSDYVTIEHNVTYLNAYWSVYGSSGISIYESTAVDGNTGVKNVIEGNVSYANEEFLDCLCSGGTAITDGNGIIVDDLMHTQDGHPELAFPGRTLVVNNVAYDNGGTGMHAFKSAHVDFVNNTIYQNSHSPALNEEGLAASSSADVSMYNNVVVAAAGKIAGALTTGATADYNLYFGGSSTPSTSRHDLVADPGFVNAPCADFRVNLGSPAHDSGTATVAGVPATNVLNETWPDGGAVDRGAY